MFDTKMNMPNYKPQQTLTHKHKEKESHDAGVSYKHLLHSAWVEFNHRKASVKTESFSPKEFDMQAVIQRSKMIEEYNPNLLYSSNLKTAKNLNFTLSLPGYTVSINPYIKKQVFKEKLFFSAIICSHFFLFCFVHRN